MVKQLGIVRSQSGLGVFQQPFTHNNGIGMPADPSVGVSQTLCHADGLLMIQAPMRLAHFQGLQGVLAEGNSLLMPAQARIGVGKSINTGKGSLMVGTEVCSEKGKGTFKMKQ